ncbi:MAG: phage integrase N-terminal SAM-like domain-containing protein [Treponema sp.]|nr:phage integrase N-terminal SAM-like domain-containing protein [Treponema sp.]
MYTRHPGSPLTRSFYGSLEEFLSAKQVEGCSERSVSYYSSTLDNLIKSLIKPFNQIETEDLRVYLKLYHF